MTLQGQQIVVVGGTSGIGLATARLAQQQGAHVTIIGRSEERLQNAAATLPGVEWLKMDVNSEQEVQEAFSTFKQINHVYIAAGSTKLGGILDGTVETQMTPIMERLWGSIYIIRAAARKIAADGSITFTGGLSTDRPVAGAWVSGVGTASVEQLARVMALELAPIRFNAVSPGYTDTPMWDSVLGTNKTAVLSGVAERLPVKRIATPEEVAQAVLFLMQNYSVTGEIIHVDGGARLV